MSGMGRGSWRNIDRVSVTAVAFLWRPEKSPIMSNICAAEVVGVMRARETAHGVPASAAWGALVPNLSA